MKNKQLKSHLHERKQAQRSPVTFKETIIKQQNISTKSDLASPKTTFSPLMLSLKTSKHWSPLYALRWELLHWTISQINMAIQTTEVYHKKQIWLWKRLNVFYKLVSVWNMRSVQQWKDGRLYGQMGKTLSFHFAIQFWVDNINTDLKWM